MKSLRPVTLAAVAFLWTAIAPAAWPQSEPIVRAEKFRIQSAVMNENLDIRVTKPANYEKSDKAYPVFYVLDAGLNFPVTAEIVRFLAAYSLVPEMIIVGIDSNDRVRDMTPNKPLPGPDAEHYKTAGGADRFLEFLSAEAIPFVDKSLRTLPDRALAGHSLSGLFAIHALLTKPDLFSSYIAISPSLWWNDYEYFGKVQAFYHRTPSLPKKVFVSLADESEKDPDKYTQLQDTFEKSAPKDLIVLVRFFKQENHITTAVTAMVSALTSLFPAQSSVRSR